jgi:XTP/dITP diphosphohydrolase
MTAQLVLASRNEGKLVELRRILGPAYELVALPQSAPDVAETGATFEENALLKARAAVDVTGLPALADDSGLTVDALNGMPGVLSARWSGQPKSDERNNTLLLDQLADVPDERRGAEFRCAVAFVHRTATGEVDEEVADGVMRGRVIRQLRGTGGFGYDVVFVPDEQDADLTSAEMSAEQKDRISHRGKSLRAIAPIVVAALRGA